MGFQSARFLVNPGPIQWSHPLANGLTGAWVTTPGALQIRDLLGVHTPTIANGPTAVTGMTGPVLKFAANNARATVTAQSALKPTKTASLFWFGTFDSAGAPTNDTLIHGVSFTNANSSPYVGYAAQRTNADPTRISFGWSNNGTYTEAVSASADMPSYGVPFSFTCTIRMGGSGIIYINDRSSASNTAGTGPLTYGATPIFHIPGHMANTAGQDNPGCSVAVAYAWNRDLSAQEVGILNEDPFVLIRPRRRLLKSASGAMTGTSAVTSGATGTLTGTGALSATCTVTSGLTGSMLALARATASSDALSGATGTLSGRGALSGTSAVTSGATGTLTGTGALSGTITITSGAIAYFGMIGTAVAASGATGTLTGTGTITGTAAAASGAVAVLRDSSLGIWDRATDPAALTWSAQDAATGSWSAAGSASTAWTDQPGETSRTWTATTSPSTDWSPAA